MKTNSFDVVIVGAGMSGLTAAAAAATSDPSVKVALITTGPGSFVFGFGWLKAYDLSTQDGTSGLREAISFWCDLTRSAGCPFVGDLSGTHYLPTLLGEFQNVAFAPATVWNERLQPGATAIIGVEGLSSFDPDFLAERLNANAAQVGLRVTYRSARVDLGYDVEIPVTPLRIAQRFDADPAFRIKLSTSLRDAADGCKGILVPGMLGLQSDQQQRAEFESRVGCFVSELPTLPPSVPTLRVYERLMRHLQKIGVELYRGFPVSKLDIGHNHCTGVTIEGPGRPTTLRGRNVVLTAGQYAAGLLGSNIAGHDGELRPLDGQGNIIAENLFVAGSLVHRGVGGDAAGVLTGFRAGMLAAAKEVCLANG